MSQRFASAVSYLFHPLLFCTYAAAFIVAVNPHLFAEYQLKTQLLWIMITFIFTCFCPVVWIVMMKQLELISDYTLSDPKERIRPYVAVATFYMWTYRLFKPTTEMTPFSNPIISMMMLGAAVSIFIGFFINIFSKVSIHAIGAGSIIGLVVFMMQVSDYDLKFVLVFAILAAGLIGTSRLMLGIHQPKEIWPGYLIGFIGQFFSFILMPVIFNHSV